MHGLSYSEGILKEALAACGGVFNGVSAVRVRVGSELFTDLNELYSAWELVADDSPLSGVRLLVEDCDGRDCIFLGVSR